ncbi:hypothetical protein GKODMF_10365 [Candidatus Electrothrix gigas]
MDLKQQPSLSLLGDQLLMHLEHSQLDNVRGCPLDRGVDGHAFGKLAAVAVGGIDLRQLPASSQQGSDIPVLPSLLHDIIHKLLNTRIMNKVAVNKGLGLFTSNPELL